MTKPEPGTSTEQRKDQHKHVPTVALRSHSSRVICYGNEPLRRKTPPETNRRRIHGPWSTHRNRAAPSCAGHAYCTGLGASERRLPAEGFAARLSGTPALGAARVER